MLFALLLLLLLLPEGKSFLFSSSEMVSLLSPLNTLNHITQKNIFHIFQKITSTFLRVLKIIYRFSSRYCHFQNYQIHTRPIIMQTHDSLVIVAINYCEILIDIMRLKQRQNSIFHIKQLSFLRRNVKDCWGEKKKN